MRYALIFFLLLLLAAAAVFYVAPVFRGQFVAPADIHFGILRIHLYGLMMSVAVLVGYFLAMAAAKRIGLSAADIDGAVPWVVILGFAGARIYYVAFSWSYFRYHLWSILAVWQGGLAIYGAILGGALGLLWYARRRGLQFWKLTDLLAVVLPAGQAIGRWGNFFNQEAFGRPTNLPWRMFVDPLHRPFRYLPDSYFHPTFLYESLWDLCVFGIMFWIFRRRSAQPGFSTGCYLVLYSIGRFFIESLRLDSFFVSTFRADQITSLVLFLAGISLIVFFHARPPLENH